MPPTADIKDKLPNISDKNNPESYRVIERVPAHDRKKLTLPAELFAVFWSFEDFSKEDQLTPLNPSDDPTKFRYPHVELFNPARYQKGGDLYRKKMPVTYVVIRWTSLPDGKTDVVGVEPRSALRILLSEKAFKKVGKIIYECLRQGVFA